MNLDSHLVKKTYKLCKAILFVLTASPYKIIVLINLA